MQIILVLFIFLAGCVSSLKVENCLEFAEKSEDYNPLDDNTFSYGQLHFENEFRKCMKSKPSSEPKGEKE